MIDRKKQIRDLISHYSNGNSADFARILGISPQGLSSWISRDRFDFELIYSKCVGVSAEWLLSGEGEMFKSQQPDDKPSNDEYSNKMCLDMIRDLSIQLGEARKELELLKGMGFDNLEDSDGYGARDAGCVAAG